MMVAGFAGARIARLFRMTDSGLGARQCELERLDPDGELSRADRRHLESHAWIGWGWATVLSCSRCPLALAQSAHFSAAGPAPNTWAAKVTFGERVWLNRKAIAGAGTPHHDAAQSAQWRISRHRLRHRALWRRCRRRSGRRLLGHRDLVYAGKLWFCDRMVWLYEDMKDRDPVYRSWLR